MRSVFNEMREFEKRDEVRALFKIKSGRDEFGRWSKTLHRFMKASKDSSVDVHDVVGFAYKELAHERF